MSQNVTHMAEDRPRRTTTSGSDSPSGSAAGSAATSTEPSRASTAQAAMPAAAPKSGSGPIGVLGPVLAVLLLVLGLSLLREALVAASALPGQQWLPAAVDGLTGARAVWWLVPVGVVVALVGVWLVVTALRPRSRRTLPLTSHTGVFLHTRDVARLASGAARDVDGVLEASTTATRRKLAVTAHGTAASGVTTGLREAVSEAVVDRLSALQSVPRVTVTIRIPSAARSAKEKQ